MTVAIRKILLAALVASPAYFARAFADAIFFEPVTDSAAAVDGGLSRGIAFGDADSDGDPDLLVANTINYPEFLYRNDGGVFVQVMELAPSLAGGFSEGVNWIDFDNDGDPDIFVARTAGPNGLYRNDLDWQFVDAGPKVLAPNDRASSMACWADFDGDGWLDLIVVNRGGDNDGLYRNHGGQRFELLGDAVPALNGGDGRACAVGDVNGDGATDLFVGNFIDDSVDPPVAQRNYLYLNRNHFLFDAVRNGPAVESAALTYGASFADVDDDGDLDLFVTNMGRNDQNELYLNDGSGHFSVHASSISDKLPAPSKGHAWGDFDLDGDLDLVIANGTEGSDRIANQLFLNDGDGRFREVTDDPFVLDKSVSAGLAWADIDGDGGLDLFVANWGDGDQDNALYRNAAIGNWLSVSPVGSISNTMAIGTKVTVLTGKKSQTRWLYPQTGYASQNEAVVHFGLGEASRVDELQVTWPSGTHSSLSNVPANRRITIIEPETVLSNGENQ